jgi:hypothetical protein
MYQFRKEQRIPQMKYLCGCLGIGRVLGGPPGRFESAPVWGCTAPRHVIALGAAAPHVSVGKEYRRCTTYGSNTRISVEQVIQTPMEEYS